MTVMLGVSRRPPVLIATATITVIETARHPRTALACSAIRLRRPCVRRTGGIFVRDQWIDASFWFHLERCTGPGRKGPDRSV